MYQPKPIDTSHVQLPIGIEELIERLAANNHAIWAQERLHEGWTYGPRRDDGAKTHPDLIPYDQLPESEKSLDRKVAVGTIKAILALGYRIDKG